MLDRIRYGILTVSALMLGVINFPLARTLIEGDKYKWIIGSFSGAGIRGDWWLIACLSSFVYALQISGWRKIRPLFDVLLLIVVLAGGATSLGLLISGGDDRFQGGTTGADYSLKAVAIFTLALCSAGTFWLWKSFKEPKSLSRAPIGRINFIFLGIFASLIPLQIFLFTSGEHHGVTDRYAIYITYTQWIIFNLGVIPWRRVNP
jgi:hypothetical protein